MPDLAIREQRNLSAEVDAEAARLIRDFGIPLFDALERAQRNIAARRRERSLAESPAQERA